MAGIFRARVVQLRAPKSPESEAETRKLGPARSPRAIEVGDLGLDGLGQEDAVVGDRELRLLKKH